MAKSNSKSSKSNKTAHVLNLLTEPGEARESSSTGSPSAPIPIHSPQDNSEEMASAIHDALQEELLAELEGIGTVPEPDSQPEPTSEEPEFVAFQPEPVTEKTAGKAAPEPAPAPKKKAVKAAPAEEKPVPQPEPEPQSKSTPDEGRPEEDITYFNVMQALVEDKVDKYMKRFNMCTCHRCRTDVIALTLSSLPAKYIVIPEHESVPMLTIYEGRYSAAVTAQIMWACQKISEHPRHTNNDDGSMRLGAPRHDD